MSDPQPAVTWRLPPDPLPRMATMANPSPKSTTSDPAASKPDPVAPRLIDRLSQGGLRTVLGGTATLALVAVVASQFVRADSARSATQTAATAERPPLARVNGVSISYDQVAEECVARHGRDVLENLINRKMIEQACAQANVTVSNAEIAAEVSEQAEKFNLPLDTWYQMLLSEQKLSQAQYHRDVVWPKLALRKLAGQNVTVSEADMQLAFERDYGPRVKARMILIEGNQRQAAKVWELARANPDDFDKLAREHSADPNSSPLGGVIPPIRRHSGLEQFEDAAFNLAIGEISSLIQMPDGKWVFIKSEGRTEPIVTDIKDVWTELLTQQKEEKVQTAVAQVFDGIKSSAQVINHLTGTATGHARSQSGVIRQASGTDTGRSGVRTAN